MVRGKPKGSKHEAEVAKLFTEWWGSAFKRTPNSGALRWQGVSWTYSDILPPDDCSVALECKIRAEIDVWALVRPGSDAAHIHHPIAWWNQSVEDAARCYRETGQVIHPMLVFREDHKKNYIALEADLFVALLGDTHQKHATLWVSHPGAHTRFVIMDLATFFSSCSREQFLDGQRKVIPWNLVEIAA